MLPANHQDLGLKNLLRPEIRANPYPFYDQLRTHEPIHWDAELGFWVLTRYADIAAVYGDSRFSRAQGLMRGFERLPQAEKNIASPVYQSFSKTVFYSDPPYHTHLRGLMNSAFTPARVEQLRPFIQRTVDELLEEAQSRGGMDFIREIAYPLPVMVIAELLGLPTADRQQFKAWSDDLFGILGTLSHGRDQMDRASHSMVEMTEYISGLSHFRRQQPRDDLLSALLAVTDANSPPTRVEAKGEDAELVMGYQHIAKSTHHLSQAELVANMNILLSTGHETTTNLLGNGLLALIQNPDQMELLQEQPELIHDAIEEMLRYDNPVQITYRSATEEVQLGDKTIHKGDLVNSILGSANRDPERFSEPGQFDIRRQASRHLGFGLGIHFCLGAPLVRLEAEIVFRSILDRYKCIDLVPGKLEWQEQPIFRGLKSLPVEIN